MAKYYRYEFYYENEYQGKGICTGMYHSDLNYYKCDELMAPFYEGLISPDMPKEMKKLGRKLRIPDGKYNTALIKILYRKSVFSFYNTVCHCTTLPSLFAVFSVMSATAFAKSSIGLPSRLATIAVTFSFDMGT